MAHIMSPCMDEPIEKGTRQDLQGSSHHPNRGHLPGQSEGEMNVHTTIHIHINVCVYTVVTKVQQDVAYTLRIQNIWNWYNTKIL